MARREVESQRDVEEIYVLILFSITSSFFVLPRIFAAVLPAITLQA
jgi:hypothetical protein